MTRLRLAWLGPLVLCVGSACTCGPTGVDKHRFACASNTDCASGFVCSPGGECVSGTATGGGSGGGKATGGGSGGGGGFFETGGGGGSDNGGGAGGGAAGGGAGGGVSTGGGSANGGGTAGGAGGGANGGGAGGGSANGGGTGGGGGTSGTGGGANGGGTGGGANGGGTGGGGGTSGTGGGANGGGTGGGANGGGTGGSGGGTSGTGGGGPVDAGPDQIIIVTAPQTLGVNVCSSDVTFNLIHSDGGAAPVNTQTNFSLAANPATNFNFYSGSACNTNTVTVTLMPGDSSGTFRFKANAGSWDISVTRVGDVGAGQTETVGYPLPDGLALTAVSGSLPYTVRAGDCSPGVQAYLTHGGVEVNANSATPVSLSSTPPGNGYALGSLKMYSDAACTSQITSAISIPVNSSRTPVFYLKALTGQTYTLTAAASTLTASASHVVLPTVRWSSCGFDAGETSTYCFLSPVQNTLANSFVISTTASAETAGAASPACGLNTNTAVSCARGAGGGPVNVSVETVELPQSSVFHGTTFCTGDGGVTVSLPGPFDLTESILLLSATDSTTALSPASFHSGQLSAGQAFFSMGDCSKTPVMEYQVVDIPGVTVDRGEVQLDAGSFLAYIGGPTGTPIDLPSFRVIDGNVDACSTGLRSENTAGHSTFNRGYSTNGCANSTLAIDWQRMSDQTGTVFDSYFQQGSFTMAAGVYSTSITLSGNYHDATRTIIFVGSQPLGGQGAGEMSGTGASVPYGDQLVMATPVINGLTLSGITLTRGSAVSAGKWTYTLLELVP